MRVLITGGTEERVRDGPIPWSIIRCTQFCPLVDAVLGQRGACRSSLDRPKCPASPASPSIRAPICTNSSQVKAGKRP
jgi:hypothetical protein